MYEHTLVGPLIEAGAADTVLVILAVLVTGAPQEVLTTTESVPDTKVEAK